jgi:hypothetical protein
MSAIKSAGFCGARAWRPTALGAQLSHAAQASARLFESPGAVRGRHISAGRAATAS